MIRYVPDILIILSFFTLFGIIHSVLASVRIKNFVRQRSVSLIAFYRLAYVVGSILLFYALYSEAPGSDVNVYDLKYPFDFIILIPQFLGLAGIIWTLKYFSIKEFLGINQISRWINKSYDPDELDEKLTLIIAGPYRYIRHPLYFFFIVFLIARPAMSLFGLIMNIGVILYFYIGSFYEEKKLVGKFGRLYTEYQRRVPRLVPLKLTRPYERETITG